jgi:hypothetical protein
VVFGLGLEVVMGKRRRLRKSDGGQLEINRQDLATSDEVILPNVDVSDEVILLPYIAGGDESSAEPHVAALDATIVQQSTIASDAGGAQENIVTSDVTVELWSRSCGVGAGARVPTRPTPPRSGKILIFYFIFVCFV